MARNISYISEAGIWGTRTDPVGTISNPEISIWDTAYGTNSFEWETNTTFTGDGEVRLTQVFDAGTSKDYSLEEVEKIHKGMALSESLTFKRELAQSGAKTHGYIKNIDTGEIKKFQFNPEVLEYSRGVNYKDMIAPGMAYPRNQFVSGKSRDFKVELFLYARQLEPSTLIKDYISFLGAFLTPEENVPNWVRPPQMLFFYGYFVRKCVLTDLNIKIDSMDLDGTPTQAHLTLSLRQVGVV